MTISIEESGNFYILLNNTYKKVATISNTQGLKILILSHIFSALHYFLFLTIFNISLTQVSRVRKMRAFALISVQLNIWLAEQVERDLILLHISLLFFLLARHCGTNFKSIFLLSFSKIKALNSQLIFIL